MATRSCCSTPRTAVAGARSATSAQAPCRSTKRSSASATIHTSWTCARPTVEPLQRIDAKRECRSLETTGYEHNQIDLLGLRPTHSRLAEVHSACSACTSERKYGRSDAYPEFRSL